jgi:protein gp37
MRVAETKIEWTERTWNPTGGCRRKSPGCHNCYAERQAYRLAHNPNEQVSAHYSGLTQITNGRPGWTGKVSLNENVLLQPLKRRKPTTYFISLSDLFYEGRPDEHIDLVFAVMALTPQHTYQILTKYTERMLAWFTRLTEIAEKHRPNTVCKTFNESDALNVFWMYWRMGMGPAFPHGPWPLPNVHLGVSVENREMLRQRCRLLRETPAVLRFLSIEPMLESLPELPEWINPGPCDHKRQSCEDIGCIGDKKIDWVIVGGESGPGARPFDIEWARQVVRQCKAAGVPCFVKQLGADPREGNTNGNCRNLDCTHPDCGYIRLKLSDRKGGDMDEWPADLRVREYPEVARG